MENYIVEVKRGEKFFDSLLAAGHLPDLRCDQMKSEEGGGDNDSSFNTDAWRNT